MSFAQIAKHFFLPIICLRMSTCPLEWEDQKLLDAVTTKRPVHTLESSRHPKQNQTTSTIVTEDIEREQLEIDNESSEETAPDICVTFKLLR